MGRPSIPAIDPTKNVLETIAATVQRQDDLRVAETKFQNAMREAERLRLDQLAAQRNIYEQRIADMLAESVKSTSGLVSTQLLQLQDTFNERLRELERFRYESSGKSTGASSVWAYIFAAASFVAAAVATLAFFLKGTPLV